MDTTRRFRPSYRTLHDLQERVKELTALIRTTRMLQNQSKSVSNIVSEIALMLPQAWQYPEVTAVRIIIGEDVFASLNFTPTAWCQRALIMASDTEVGRIEVFYLEPRPHESEGPFMIEERDLLNVIAEMLGSFLDRRKAEADLMTAREELERRVEDRTRRIREYQEQLRTLTAEMALVEERERRKIAVELHDQIGQTLALIKIRLGSLATQAIAVDIADELNAVRSLTEDAIQFTRSLMTELSPPVLYELGCVAAMEWLVDQVREKYGLEIRFVDDGMPKFVDDRSKIALFKSARELLMNVVKHAGATTVWLRMRCDGQTVTVEVQDDGVGFDPSTCFSDGSSGGFGLLSIRERMHHVGGTFTTESSPGAGTTMIITVPGGQ